VDGGLSRVQRLYSRHFSGLNPTFFNMYIYRAVDWNIGRYRLYTIGTSARARKPVRTSENFIGRGQKKGLIVMGDDNLDLSCNLPKPTSYR
jgi:hypothetical protein